jgi:hypothetical protein
MADRVPLWKQPRPIHMRKKFWTFVEGPFFWGPVGLLFGALAAVISMKIFYVVAGVGLSIAIVRAEFFEGRPYAQRFSGNALFILIIGVMLYVGWRFTPKVKEPATADDIAIAVIKKQHEDVQKVAGTPPPATPPPAAATPKRPPKQLAQKVIPNTPGESEPKTIPSEPNPAPPPPQQARLIVSQKQQVSTREDAPYKTEVTVQATTDFPSLKLIIQCDKPLVDAGGGMTNGGVLMMTSQGLVKDHPNVYLFTYQSAAPQFGPQNPIAINVWSKESVKCGAATF